MTPSCYLLSKHQLQKCPYNMIASFIFTERETDRQTDREKDQHRAGLGGRTNFWKQHGGIGIQENV